MDLGTAIQTIVSHTDCCCWPFPAGCSFHCGIWFFAWPLAKLAALLPLTQGGIGVEKRRWWGCCLLLCSSPSHTAAGLVWKGGHSWGVLWRALQPFFLAAGKLRRKALIFLRFANSFLTLPITDSDNSIPSSSIPFLYVTQSLTLAGCRQTHVAFIADEGMGP